MATASDVADCFLTMAALDGDDEGLSHLKLQKLLYYAQGCHLALFGRPLFEEPLEAWQHGPVCPAVYQLFRSYGSAAIPPPPDDAACERLTSDERDLLREVYDVYGQFSAWKLRDLTHSEEPWQRHAADAGVIANAELQAFFASRVR